jgi:TRAP-type C4-dicarboxylate transport system substrate-binding protein
MVPLVTSCTGTGPAPADVIELSYSEHTPSTHLKAGFVVEPWIKTIEEETKGRVKINVVWASALLSGPDAWDGLKNGVADMAAQVIGVNPGRFPMSEMMVYPGLNLTLPENKIAVRLAVNAYWAAYEAIPELQQEWAENKILSFRMSPSAMIHSVEPVYTLADLKGFKMPTPGGATVHKIEALGMVPVTMGMGDMYSGIEQGIVDGFFADSGLLVARKFGEVCGYSLVIDAGHGGPFWFAMNWDTWNSLPSDIQKVFEENTGASLTDMYGQSSLNEALEGEKGAIEQYGHVYDYPTPEENAKINAALAPLVDDYAQQLEDKGLPGFKMRDFIRNWAEENKSKYDY